MLTVVTSGKASPGVSATVWALGLAWPGEGVLVADADPVGGDLASGFLAGRVDVARGLLSWAIAARGEVPALQGAALLAEHAVTVPERPGLWLLPGVADAVAGRSLTSQTWGRLALALERSSAVLGRDALVDAGRLAGSSVPNGALFHAADRVLVAVRSSVRSVHAATQAVSWLRESLGDVGSVSALVIGNGPYTAGEISAALGIPVLGALPADPRAAAVVMDGAAMPWPRLARSPLLRVAASLARGLATVQPAEPARAPQAEVAR
jgi:MinD-like ATPase involved in chromosome partitioning or flagellar assembly